MMKHIMHGFNFGDQPRRYVGWKYIALQRFQPLAMSYLIFRIHKTHKAKSTQSFENFSFYKNSGIKNLCALCGKNDLVFPAETPLFIDTQCVYCISICVIIIH